MGTSAAEPPGGAIVAVTGRLHNQRMGENVTIDCDECRLEGTGACDDCVVTHLLGAERSTAVVIDLQAVRAVRVLGDAGLVPQLRHATRTR